MQFTFLLVELSIFKQNTKDRVRRILEEHGCHIYRIYRVLGQYDLVIRVYIQEEMLKRLEKSVAARDKNVQPISSIKISAVDKLRKHWHWGKHKNRRCNLSMLEAVGIEEKLEQPDWEANETIYKAIKRGVIRPVQHRKDNIITFVFIEQTQKLIDRNATVAKAIDAFNRLSLIHI